MTSPNTLKREEIDPQYKWDFTHIYSDWDAWKMDFDRIKAQSKELIKFKEQLKTGAPKLLQTLQLMDEIEKILYKVYA